MITTVKLATCFIVFYDQNHNKAFRIKTKSVIISLITLFEKGKIVYAIRTVYCGTTLAVIEFVIKQAASAFCNIRSDFG
jgi:hypothetical protein